MEESYAGQAMLHRESFFRVQFGLHPYMVSFFFWAYLLPRRPYFSNSRNPSKARVSARFVIVIFNLWILATIDPATCRSRTTGVLIFLNIGYPLAEKSIASKHSTNI